MVNDTVDLILDAVQVIVRSQFDTARTDAYHRTTIVLEDFVMFWFAVSLDIQYRQVRPGAMAVGGDKCQGDLPVDPMYDLFAFCGYMNVLGNFQIAVFGNCNVDFIDVDSFLCPQRKR